MPALRRRKEENRDVDSDTDSLSDSASEIVHKPKSRRPKETAFTQQKLKAYHPILTPKTVIPIFLILAVIFIPLGAGMVYGSQQIEELIIEYQDCASKASSEYYTDVPKEYVDYSFHKDVTIQPKWKYATNSSESDEDEAGLCHIQFQIPDDIGSPVYLFYKLKKFYANHRRYVKSFSEDQLNGKAASLSTIKDTVGQNCEPLSENHEGKRYYPCGLIANSLFNDTFSSPVGINKTTEDYEMTEEGIAWASDKNRFKKTKYKPSEVVPPPNWHKKFPNGYTEENMPDISKWPQFQNWMHALGLPTFSRLVLRNDDEAMKAGTYEIVVGLHFPVTEYNGSKAIFLSTLSVIGGKNSFLGIAWIVAGLICFILGFVFMIIHVLHPRKTGDLSYLSWNKEQPAIALPLERDSTPERTEL